MRKVLIPRNGQDPERGFVFKVYGPNGLRFGFCAAAFCTTQVGLTLVALGYGFSFYYQRKP